jgi:hypothetical protein
LKEIELTGGFIMYKKILVPVDGSEKSIDALKEAIKLATELGENLHLTVLHITPPININELTVGAALSSYGGTEGRRFCQPLNRFSKTPSSIMIPCFLTAIPLRKSVPKRNPRTTN